MIAAKPADARPADPPSLSSRIAASSPAWNAPSTFADGTHFHHGEGS